VADRVNEFLRARGKTAEGSKWLVSRQTSCWG
jgi:hypothetical protein